MKLQKAAAIAVSLALVFAMLFSLFFLVAEADHDCASDDCAICRMIHITEDLLKKVILSVCAAAIAAAAWFSVIGARFFCVRRALSSTPVELRVKLSD